MIEACQLKVSLRGLLGSKKESGASCSDGKQRHGKNKVFELLS